MLDNDSSQALVSMPPPDQPLRRLARPAPPAAPAPVPLVFAPAPTSEQHAADLLVDSLLDSLLDA